MECMKGAGCPMPFFLLLPTVQQEGAGVEGLGAEWGGV